MKFFVKNPSKPVRKAAPKSLDAMTNYELIVLVQKQCRALKRKDNQIEQLNNEVNRTILECNRDFDCINIDLDRVKKSCKDLEINNLKECNVLPYHAQVELQLTQAMYATLQQKHGVTPSLIDEVKTMRIGQSSLPMGDLNHEFFKN